MRIDVFQGRLVNVKVAGSKSVLTGWFVGIDEGFVILSQTQLPPVGAYVAAPGPFSAIDRDTVCSINEVIRPTHN